jgi:hypothetical protein
MNSFVNWMTHPAGFNKKITLIVPDAGGSQNTGVRKKLS